MYLQIKTVKKIRSASDEFVMSQPDGKLVLIDFIGLYDDNGKFQRSVTMNDELFQHLQSLHLPLPNPKKK